VALLLILRLFDKPGITAHGVAANVGIQWGIFFALAASGLLALAGSRMRAGERPEPPLLRRTRRPQPEPPPVPRAHRSDPPDRAPIARAPEEPGIRSARRPPAPRTAPARAPRRPVSPDDATEQLSFEDHATELAPDLRSDPAPEPEQR
jgi:hypothetical protein